MAEESNPNQCVVDPKTLTIKIANSSTKNPATVTTTKATLDSSVSPSPYNSPSLISPPSSAFVSALQSPYISPRATVVSNPNLNPNQEYNTSYCGSQSDDVPSTSYTPPPERYDFSDEPTDQTLKIVTCVPVSGPDTDPRISFSFPVPRISFAKGSISPAKLRSCDVYIGYNGQNPNLARFCKWLKSELEIQGIAAFVADRAKYADNQSHEIADRVICSVTFGIVVITNCSVFNHMSVEEVRFFAQKKNLIPLFFGTDANEVSALASPENKKCKEALDAVLKSNEYRLEAKDGEWRSCVSRAASILRAKLGRRSVVEKNEDGVDDLPFPRNRNFIGRDKELVGIETAFFGDSFEQENGVGIENIRGGTTPGQSEGLADDESEMDANCRGKYINLEFEPGRNSTKRSKCKKSKCGKDKSFGSSVVCISGSAGVGKTELALEFAYRYCQRYKMVLWVGGEALYFRQNILNVSVNLGLDVSADVEKERGRIRSFDEQESEAFKRVKREMFRDMPYLLIIDNLESEKEWWEGKDLHDLIPSNTGGTHIIVTTRLSRVMNLDPIQLQPLPVSEAMALIKGKQKKQYPVEEEEFILKFIERLRSSSFGLSVIRSMLSELEISPSVLLEAVNQIPLEDNSSEEHFCRNNPFLMKTLVFCAAVLQQSKNFIASRMLQVGAWLAPTPVSASILATASNKIPDSRNRLRKWTKSMKLGIGLFRCLRNQTWKSEEEEAAFLLVRMGLARQSNRQPGIWIQLHPITQIFAKRKDGLGSGSGSGATLSAAKATVQGVRRMGNPITDSDHMWASAFLVFGFKSEPPNVQLNATEMVLFIRKTALPLAINAFTTFSRCNSALELLKVCTNVLEEVEKSFVSQIQDWHHASLCWKKTLQSNHKVDEYVWQQVTLLKATLLETRAKLLLRGGHFDSGEELCRTCISIRTVMLGHNHAHTLSAQQTLAKLVRMRSKI